MLSLFPSPSFKLRGPPQGGGLARVGSSSNSSSSNSRSSPTSGGPFRVLPVEILHCLFEYLSLPDLGNLALSSAWLRQVVESWSRAQVCPRRVARDAGREGILMHRGKMVPSSSAALRDSAFGLVRSSSSTHRGFAVLVKRLTCLLSTQERIRMAFVAFDRVLNFEQDHKNDAKRRRNGEHDQQKQVEEK